MEQLSNFCNCCVPVVKSVSCFVLIGQFFILNPDTLLLTYSLVNPKSSTRGSEYIRPVCHSPLMETYHQWRFCPSERAGVQHVSMPKGLCQDICRVLVSGNVLKSNKTTSHCENTGTLCCVSVRKGLINPMRPYLLISLSPTTGQTSSSREEPCRLGIG